MLFLSLIYRIFGPEHMKKYIYIIFLLFSAYLSSSLFVSHEQKKSLYLLVEKEILPPFYNENYKWADSIFDSLSTDERIAQLLMVAAYSNKDEAHVNEIKKLVSEYKIGGLIFMQGTPEKEVELTNTYQSIARVPLMIAIDGEWGLPMRLKNTFQFPKQMTLGAIQHDSLIYQMGKEMAMHCKRIGIHVNFAPVVDVNNNPNNPIINYRSFGENRENVAQKGIALMKGMQDNGVLACAKHFPGHGDTDTDSHKSLPVINHSLKRLDSIEFYPFKKLIKEGLGSMMVAHLYIPALDSTKNVATTLSKKVVTGLLKEDMGFKGLIFTDALNMKGVSSYYKPGVVDVKALIAGNDILLFSEDVSTAISEIKKAIANGEITQEEIDQRCKKVLYAKEWLGVNKNKISTDNLNADLNPLSSEVTNRLLFENALTLIKNDSNLVPFKNLDKRTIASVVIGNNNNNLFQESLSLYTKVTHFSISKKASSEQLKSLITKLKLYNTVVLSVHQTRMNGSYGITSNTIKVIEQIAKNKEVILNFPTNPYALVKFNNTANINSIIVSYEDNKYTQQLVSQLIFGGIEAKGKLPVSITTFKEGTGFSTKKTRLNYVLPEEIGINTDSLNNIDSIALQGIKDGAYPGCQILVAKDGHVFYNKSFGYHTYNNKNKVKNNDLYDIASVTKVAVTTAIVMKMYEEGTLHLDSTLSAYLPNIVDSTKYKNIVIKDMLAHQARFQPWIPFYAATINEGKLNPRFYKSTKSSFYDTEVAEDIFIFKNYKSAILKRITDTDLRRNKKYKYSDIGYYFLKEIIEIKTNRPLNFVIDSMYYNKLGLQYATYNPRNKFDLAQITPTENDLIFRKQLVHGYVHDQGAAMMGGIGGHAGLFSNANDLAIIMQMYLDKGTYGGDRFVGDSIVDYFTQANFKSNDNRRGIGFDKPVFNLDGGPTCNLVSLDSYGHSGFTGTRVWADPKNGLVYVFLSNRVYPDAENRKLVKQDIRTRIEEVIYKAL
jgi:beta-N-acetylhexosaminidase